ncbi:unnamed protein product, partial [Didymodactylos carnosus]
MSKQNYYHHNSSSSSSYFSTNQRHYNHNNNNQSRSITPTADWERPDSRRLSPLLPPVASSSQVRRRDESRPYAHTTSSEELQDHRSRQSQHNT